MLSKKRISVNGPVGVSVTAGDWTFFWDGKNESFLFHPITATAARRKTEKMIAGVFMLDDLTIKCSGLCLFFKVDLLEFAFQLKFLVDAIEDTVDELPALMGAIAFCKVNVFVDGHFRRNGFKIQ